MKILVCGGRDFNDAELMEDVLKEYYITEIIEGEARGADALSRRYAEHHGIPVRAFPADWKTYGKRAGYIRNSAMLSEGKPDCVVAFPGGKGTEMMIKLAKKAGIEVRIIEI